MATATHPTCGKTFPGSNSAGHCATCCETFIGLTAFENHRVGDFPDGRRCEIQPYESVGDDGKTRFGHWADDRGYWHHGKRMTQADKEARGWA